MQLNLFLAVLKTKFAKAKNLLDEKRRHRRAMKGAKDSKKQNILMRTGGWLKGELLVQLHTAAYPSNHMTWPVVQVVVRYRSCSAG